MRFTKQDAVTFALGIGVAVAIEVARALMRLEGMPFAEIQWADFFGNLAIGSLVATGRYLATRLPEALRSRT